MHRLLAPLLVLACTPAADPCDAMCAEVVVVQGMCLQDWDVGWEAVGYSGADDRLDACETWAWELRILERDAGASGTVDATCGERELVFAEGDCSDYTAVDWNALPWED